MNSEGNHQNNYKHAHSKLEVYKIAAGPTLDSPSKLYVHTNTILCESGFVNCLDWSFTLSQNYVHYCGSSCKMLFNEKSLKPSSEFWIVYVWKSE